MDVLADLLTRARARGALFAHSTLRGPWGLEFADDEPLSLHAVLEGEVHVEMDGEAPLRLLQGDVLLVRADRPYRFVHAPGARARPLLEALAAPRRPLRRPAPRLRGRRAAGGPAVRRLHLHGLGVRQPARALPPLLPLQGVTGSDPSLRAALALLAEEVQRDAPGQQTVLDRLLDLLLVYAMRAWFGRDEAHPPPWYAALDDPYVGPALRRLHGEPQRAWTVAELAAEAGLSRAAFARRFTELTGHAPLTYLTEWRMVLAQDALRRPGATLASVAHEIGYGSEFAFANAFKRQLGVPPGRWRREQAAAV
jgi:AraC-like DNA-binding protein